MDFIAKYVWVFVTTGAIIIIVAIGYLVDKLVINKNGNINSKKQKNVNNQEIIPNVNNQNNEFVQNNYVPTNEPISNLEISEPVPETLFDSENVKEESVNIDTEKSEDSIWKV